MKTLLALAVAGLLVIGVAFATTGTRPASVGAPPLALVRAAEPIPVGIAVLSSAGADAPAPAIAVAPPAESEPSPPQGIPIAMPDVVDRPAVAVGVPMDVAPMDTPPPNVMAPWKMAAAQEPDGGVRAQILEDLGPPPAPAADPRPFAEAHWQGLEAIPKTPTLSQALRLPPDLQGVILDDVTLPGDLQGFRAGDVVTAIDGVPTPNLVAFIRATDRIREQKRVVVDIVRGGVAQRLELVALLKRLGTANGETPPMIPPSARRPHPYMGPCVNCHRIGTTGNLANDQGDTLLKNMPGPVRITDPVQHRDRGPCATCHPILP